MNPPLIPELVWTRARQAHDEPHRHYHDFSHVLEVRDRYQQVARDVGWEHPREVLLAVLFHDAIYQPGAADNETRSAQLARRIATDDWPGHGLDLDYVSELIELTAHHGALRPAEVGAEAALFLDCDMAILGADAERFRAYDRAVAAEYRAVVPADAYAAGRRQFLARLAAAPRIFLSDYFHQRLDRPARGNLFAALAEVDDRALFEVGVELFERGDWWLAHEAWETLWQDRQRPEGERHLLQGLIQCAAALLQCSRGKQAGAASLLWRARQHFAKVGTAHCGIDLGELERHVELALAEAGGAVQIPRH